MSKQTTSSPPSETQAASPPAPSDKPQQIPIDDSHAACTYANFCRVTGTPEELILDFGLNSQPFGTPSKAIEVKQRLIVNYYTAKRMLQALHLSVQRHEQAFGALEVDVQKRVLPSARAAQSSQA